MAIVPSSAGSVPSIEGHHCPVPWTPKMTWRCERREIETLLKLLEFAWWLAGWFAPRETKLRKYWKTIISALQEFCCQLDTLHHQPANHSVIIDCFGTLAGVRFPDRIAFLLLVSVLDPDSL